MDDHVVGIGRERTQVFQVSAEDGATGFGQGDDDRINF